MLNCVISSLLRPSQVHDNMRSAVASLGIRGLYKGILPGIVQVVPYMGINVSVPCSPRVVLLL